ncbi:MAG: hypothetical protein HC824_00060 [Synechococcales cyanobacterium RM1_1_8]|nr:hypothetical protein [Synechococcales cyanobacterium RM1_1_8]
MATILKVAEQFWRRSPQVWQWLGSRARQPDFILVFGFALLALLGVLHHELWEDELQAWMLARDSGSPWELLHNMRFEGHPALWHILLFGLTQFGHDPFMMQILHLLIAIGFVSLINFCSPFSQTQKIFLTFSYFFLYEYTVISRSYGLGVFLAFLFCSLTGRDRAPSALGQSPAKQQLRWRIVILVALANTSVYGLILSILLSIYLFNEQLAQGQLLNPQLGRANLGAVALASLGNMGLSSLALASGWLLSAWQILRAFESETLRRWVFADLAPPQALAAAATAGPAASPFQAAQASLGFGLERVIQISHLIAYVWKSYVPIPQLNTPSFWNKSLFSDTPFIFGTPLPGAGGVELGQALSVLFSIVLLVAVFKWGLTRPIMRRIYLVGNLLFLLFFYFFLPTGIRHHGHLFIFLIICIWLDRIPAETHDVVGSPQKAKPWVKTAFTALLLVQSLVGLYALRTDWIYDFSASRDAVRWIREQNLEQLPMAGMRSWETSVFSGYLGREIYYPELDRFGSFITPIPVGQSYAVGIEKIRDLVREQGKVLVLLDRVIEAEKKSLGLSDWSVDSPSPEFEVIQKKYFEADIVGKESYNIYVVQHRAP